MPLLTDFTWKTKYTSDEGHLVTDFYVPALSCAERYHRTTGYFSARVLTLASRGIEGLVRNDGRMRLLVGWTLNQPEVEAIEKGESLRQVVEEKLGEMPLDPSGPGEEDALELLSWMVARGFLEIKVGIPCGADRRPKATNLLFHEKAGVIADKTGDRLAFSGSLNETAQGWTGNWESFHVFTDWDGGKAHVDAEEETFSRLWADKAPRCRVVEVHQAVKDDLLRFLPKGDRPPRRLSEEPSPPPIVPPSGVEPYDPGPSDDELRRLVWGLIRHGPALSL